MTTRRLFLKGLLLVPAAPAIVRAVSLMPGKGVLVPEPAAYRCTTTFGPTLVDRRFMEQMAGRLLWIPRVVAENHALPQYASVVGSEPIHVPQGFQTNQDMVLVRAPELPWRE